MGNLLLIRRFGGQFDIDPDTSIAQELHGIFVGGWDERQAILHPFTAGAQHNPPALQVQNIRLNLNVLDRNLPVYRPRSDRSVILGKASINAEF
jgi:hypothetical protein